LEIEAEDDRVKDPRRAAKPKNEGVRFKYDLLVATQAARHHTNTTSHKRDEAENSNWCLSY